MKRVLEYGLQSTDLESVWACSMVIFSFIFQCRAVTVAHLAHDDVTVNADGISSKLTHRKGKSPRRPLILHYPQNPACETDSGPTSLIQRWISRRLASPGLFNLRYNQRLDGAHLSEAVTRALQLVSAAAPPTFYYGSHSPRIGGVNQLVNLQFFSSVDNAAPWLGF